MRSAQFDGVITSIDENGIQNLETVWNMFANMDTLQNDGKIGPLFTWHVQRWSLCWFSVTFHLQYHIKPRRQEDRSTVFSMSLRGASRLFYHDSSTAQLIIRWILAWIILNLSDQNLMFQQNSKCSSLCIFMTNLSRIQQVLSWQAMTNINTLMSPICFSDLASKGTL